ncbi:MAG: response regulator [Frankiales bacterium]|nr:response regulator [Frankiales bacterium]
MRVVIAEDAALFREGLARLLEDAGHEVVGRAADAEAFVDVVRRTRPDIVVVDIEMPPHLGHDGARAASRLREDYPDLAVLLLSAHVETQHSVELMRSGRFGYLLKDRVLDVEDFLDALRRVGSGGSALDPEVVTRLLGPRTSEDPLSTLTPREWDVLSLIAEGRTNRGIARRLWLTERTVETHVASIIAKLGLADDHEHNRRVLAVLAYLQSRVTPPRR